jgi:Zn-finger nucleic acid-binding protein
MTANRSLNCPACARSLDQRREHGVTVDYCPECGGVWLDPGELEQLTGHSSHSHSHSHSDIDVDDAFEEEEDEEEEGGILGSIAGALGGEEEEGEFEGEFEEEGGFEEEDEF